MLQNEKAKSACFEYHLKIAARKVNKNEKSDYKPNNVIKNKNIEEKDEYSEETDSESLYCPDLNLPPPPIPEKEPKPNITLSINTEIKDKQLTDKEVQDEIKFQKAVRNSLIEAKKITAEQGYNIVPDVSKVNDFL